MVPACCITVGWVAIVPVGVYIGFMAAERSPGWGEKKADWWQGARTKPSSLAIKELLLLGYAWGH